MDDAALQLPGGPKPTLRDVAAAAGVSYQPVSRVINGHERISTATRTRVIEVIARLHYSPNEQARGLRELRRPTAVSQDDGADSIDGGTEAASS